MQPPFGRSIGKGDPADLCRLTHGKRNLAERRNNMKTHIQNSFTCLRGASTRSWILPALLAGLGLLLPAFGASAGVVLTSLHSFQAFTNGGYPVAALVQGSDGNLYGTTQLGGTANSGTVFKISTNGALTSLYSFTGGNDGADPRPRWCRAATAISMARLTAAARRLVAPCSKSAPMGR